MNNIAKFVAVLLLLLSNSCLKFDPLEENELAWKGLWENEVMTLEIYENGWAIMTRNDKLTDKIYQGGINIKSNSLTIDRSGTLPSIKCSVQEHPTTEIFNGELIDYVSIDNQKLIKSK